MPEKPMNDNMEDKLAQLGQYYLIKKIAQGGMAEIYKGIAYDIHGMKRTVVIKKILPSIAANKEFVEMLVSEAKLAVLLNHGNIAQIYDLGKAGSDYFMVMEYVDGKSLSAIHKRCVKNGELIPLQYTCHIISEVSAGLDYMHSKSDSAGRPLGIVHRDISPQNIIISHSGTAKIIDFGIAKSKFKVDETEAGILKGKFAYMSPEQALGEEIDGRSDIFSLGVILHELSTGRRLFKDKDNKATIKNVRKAEVKPPSSYNKELSPEFDEIVMHALEKERSKRYQDASLLRNDLQKFLYNNYPDFKPSEIVKFIYEIFGADMELEEEEPETTPVLIIDQTQSALDISGQGLMKKFMLEEQEVRTVEKIEKSGKSANAGAIVGKFKSCSTVVQQWFNNVKQSLNKFLARYALPAFILIAVAGIFWAGWHFNFFKPLEIIKEGEKPLAEKFATLIVESNPLGASIYIDDMLTKYKTPATITDVRANGKVHTLGLYLDGYKFLSSTFTANTSETLRINPELLVAYGALEINFEPLGAAVYINGEKRGVTPFSLEEIIPNSVLKVRVEKEGFIPWEDEVKIFANRVSILRASLMHAEKKQWLPSVPEVPTAPAPAPAEEKIEVKTESKQIEPDIPLLPPAPVIPETSSTPKEVAPGSAAPATEEPESPLPPGAPTPESRPNQLELDYPH